MKKEDVNACVQRLVVCVSSLQVDYRISEENLAHLLANALAGQAVRAGWTRDQLRDYVGQVFGDVARAINAQRGPAGLLVKP